MKLLDNLALQVTRGALNKLGIYKHQEIKVQRTIGEKICVVELEFDDECGNGHMDFSITGTTYRGVISPNTWESGGCIQDEVIKFFPEFEHLIKWHLCSTDGPMHYVANTMYHASDKDHHGRRKGEPCQWEYRIYFGNSPVGHALTNKMHKFVQQDLKVEDLAVHSIEYDKKSGGYNFSPKWTLAGLQDSKWYECPFNSEIEAKEWADGLAGDFRIEQQVKELSEGKERDLDAARSCAIWPDATDEELMAPDLEQKLKARLPALLAEFRQDMEALGFEWKEPTHV